MGSILRVAPRFDRGLDDRRRDPSRFDEWEIEALHIDGSDIDDPDDARPIGSRAQGLAAHARRVELDVKGNVVFKTEEPFTLYPSVLQQLPAGFGSCWRFEAKALPRPAAIREGDLLLLTEHPYHTGWHAKAAFKRGLHRSRDERMDFALHALTKPVVETSQNESTQKTNVAPTPESILNGLDVDVFETGKALTASVLPLSTHLVDSKQKNRRTVRWVFGVCRADDHRALRDALEGSALARDLLRWTADGTIRIGHPNAGLTLDPSLHDEGNSILPLAVCQALAGPPGPGDKTPEQLLDRIYRQHLCNLERRLRSERRRARKARHYLLIEHELREAPDA